VLSYFLRWKNLGRFAEKDEHRTSNVQHRMLNEGQKQGQEFHFRINLRSEATSLFDVRRSMFDVGRSSFNIICSTFIVQNNPVEHKKTALLVS